MALSLKDLKNKKKNQTITPKGHKKRNLKPWESYNAFETTKTQTIRAHEAVIKAQERLKTETANFQENFVKDDIFSEYVYHHESDELPKSKNFKIISDQSSEKQEELQIEKIRHLEAKKSEFKIIHPRKNNGLWTFIKYLTRC